jgi:hypothetical protein
MHGLGKKEFPIGVAACDHHGGIGIGNVVTVPSSHESAVKTLIF